MFYYKLGNRGWTNEQTGRSRARHTGLASPEDPRLGTAPRLGSEPEAETGVRGSAASQRRLALPRTTQARTRGMGHRRMEGDGEWPAGQVLLPDAARSTSLGARSRQLGTISGRHLPSHP